MGFVEKHERRYPHGRTLVTWRARYRDPTGKERSKTFPRKVDAEKHLTTVEASKLRGAWVDPQLGRTPFADYVDEWLPATASRRAGTRANIDGRLRNHLLPYFGEMPLAAIRPTHVRGWLAEMQAKGLAAGTVRSAYQLLAKILRTAEIDGLIGRTPCVGADLPKDTGREEMRFLDPEEIARLASAIAPRYAALVYTAAYTGMR